ncbi:transporter substrate-binding domain-containing protein [Cytobacillus purgationiresistens]|uniref:Polar amino acid transport system substrate-binding protein n=1 Tax=Cytobacillus purgationiresistens TaxID=863449 RepID=A0ABU0ADQ5_9BACI|nr:transporter substrate-binding domain-containing protein [Cytobacillus purgationiresistens]MDQ0269367.1 polar amino acid transport system substrate-binding protein [Cytobacillus purgationiresistens]
MKKKWLSLLVMFVLLAGVLAACGTSESSSNGSGEGESKKKLIMGTSADYPPFEFIDTAKGDEIIGVDPDIAHAVAKKLGYEVEIRDMDFGGLIQALQSGQVDFVLSAMSATEDRKKNVDFSEIYYTSKHMIVTKKGSDIASIDDLEGKTVGTQLGSIQETKAKDLAKEMDMKVENRNRIPELIQEIKAGRLDAAIIEDTVAQGFFEKDEELDGFTIEDADGGYAIALPKNSELTEEFNEALKEMIDNGEVDEIIKKWFSKE